jgi:hypothetical protein
MDIELTHVRTYIPRCIHFNLMIQGSVSDSRAKVGHGQSAKRFNRKGVVDLTVDTVDLTGVDSDSSESSQLKQKPRPDRSSLTPSGIMVRAYSCTFSQLVDSVRVVRYFVYATSRNLSREQVCQWCSIFRTQMTKKLRYEVKVP